MKIYIRITISFMILFCFLPIKAQNEDNDIREMFSSVVFISDSVPVMQKINNKEYEIVLKTLDTKKMRYLKTLKTGSGFFVIKSFDIYLVTAQHVAKGLTYDAKLKYQDSDGFGREILLRDLFKNDTSKIEWISHATADVSVLHIPKEIMDTDYFESLKIRAFNYFSLNDKLEGPDRLKELTVFGFPLGLGVYPTVAPITKNLRPASDIVYLPRADNGITNPFFLLDDPSISGFSGGPVLKINYLPDQKIDIDFKLAPNLLGLVHGTINDKTGGFAAIVPSVKIVETIDKAPSFNGKYTFYYETGELWSERIYKDGIPWEVISNFKKNGEPQKKGTLKNGNGILYIYDSEGNAIMGEEYKNGRLIGDFKILTEKELKKYNLKN